MSLEDSMNTLAKAMDKYADAITAALNTDPKKFVIVNISGAADAATSSAATPAADATAAKGKGGRPKKETPAATPAADDTFGEGTDTVSDAEAEDPFGEAAAEVEAPKLTAVSIRALVLKVKIE
jgi:hypothetical protein